MENRSIEVKIENPPTTKEYQLYFDVQMKDPDWQSWHTAEETSGYCHYNLCPPYSYFIASAGEYTVISCYANFTVGSKVDFQVKAYYGKTVWDNLQDHPLAIYSNFEVKESSSWSPTQTITIGEPEYHTTENNGMPSTLTTPTAPTKSTVTNTENVQQAALNKFLFGLEWKDTAIALLAAVVAFLAATLIIVLIRKQER
jgi:hypothetical protein